ncbi:chitin synthase-domain-containing protein [Mucor mucedo]|uniref:chitin synthase-domain-containing protein n=1 Tax=Mucor mucedo TaxID=29922 RepID=UPI00221E4F1E|nr:chitin synthase-domain-containing protein [Mucor mucedo]KAI7896143.1 chitin synthase-domain-containing protein [Mucor mucedo]
MGNSENNSENPKGDELNGLPPISMSRNQNRSESSINVDTSMPQQSQNTGSQKHSGVARQPDAKRNELPTDSRPERTQRPEDLKRAQYLSTASEIAAIDTDDNEKIKKNPRKPPTCWQAWREKVSLVQVIIFLCAIVGFLTFGFNTTVCGRQPNRIRPTGVEYNHIVISGRAFDLKSFRHPTPVPDMPGSGDLQELGVGGRDLSFLFQTVNYNCKGILNPIQPDDDKGNVANYFPCVSLDRYNPDVSNTDNAQRNGCHISTKSRIALRRLDVIGDIYYNWTDIQKPGTSLVAFNGNVLDLSRLRYLTPNIPLPIQVAQIVGPGNAFIGRDATYWLSTTADRLQIGKCLTDILKVGVVDTRSTGCIISDIVLWVSLAVILGVVLIRFFLALVFGWFVSWKLGSIREESDEDRKKRQEQVLQWEMNNAEDMHYPRTQSIASIPEVASVSAIDNSERDFIPNPNPLTSDEISSASQSLSSSQSPQAQKSKKRFFPSTSRFTQPGSPKSTHGSRTFGSSDINTATPDIPYTLSSQFFQNFEEGGGTLSQGISSANIQAKSQYNFNFDLIHTFMVVTCYSEGEEGLRTTLDSLANTDYPCSHKMLLVICDGIITGSGNGSSTPDIVLSMMKGNIVARDQVQPSSYVAIADGMKRHNMAQVHAGYYSYSADTPEDQQQQVPMIVIIKCGTEAESKDKKPGNRGKRDSQVILMNTMQKVYYGERMCDLEYQFCKAIVKLTGNHPSRFETCLMVDADTKVYPDSLARMIACMSRDPYIMGLCGETKIANKADSWVTAIQVFEYYISHHMSKAFESIFGGVTCLPGCFCMYRIIAPKGDRYVPIFCSSDIVEMYCENVVDTLHKKNLLLLGEDRYLTTLMLRTFPKRKMMFVPQAVCKTVVPDTFEVLLSQRRRWINSTVHNLLELVLIRDLCGTFCFSMQFVVFMELVGTVVLPAAISFTVYLIIISFFVTPIPIIPLLLLAAILGLPAILIALTTRKMVYIGWMCVYLLSLPIWNFILPAYAYWHFDDFSWGQTRMLEGAVPEKKEDHGRREGEFDSTGIIMRRFEEWARQERKLMAEKRMSSSTVIRSYPKVYYGH